MFYLEWNGYTLMSSSYGFAGSVSFLFCLAGLYMLMSRDMSIAGFLFYFWPVRLFRFHFLFCIMKCFGLVDMVSCICMCMSSRYGCGYLDSFVSVWLCI